jgi:cobalt-zinc-cadmium efflux system outer membrane protein
MFAHQTCALAALGTALCALVPGSARADAIRSLDEATFLAELHDRSPRLEAGAARARAAELAVGAAGARPNPSLAWEREAVPGLDTHDDYVRLAIPIDLSGRRGLALAAAREEAAAVAAEASRARIVVEIEARRAYAAAAGARQRVASLEAARARLAELVDVLGARAKSGDAAEYDAERVALELALLDDELATARRALAAAQVALGGMLGAPDTPIEATDDVVLPVLREADGAQRLDVVAARRRASAARTEARQMRRGWFPRLELGVGLVVSGNETDRGVGYVVSIGGDLPLLDRGGAAARRADAAAAMWDAEGDALAVEADADVAEARVTVAAVTEQARAFAEGPAQRAAKLTRGAEVAYREGDRSIVELLDALRAERTTQARALDLVLEAHDAELDLWLALGRIP